MTIRRVKRVEIVVDSLHLTRVLEALAEAGVPVYTVLPNAEGRGERGQQRADDVSGSSGNAYVLVAIDPDQVSDVAEQVRPLLHAFGGICLISDAEWLEH